ncbi:MAG: hypothetical protein ACSLE9_07995 [Burkholderiaceae bacterium]
MPYRYLRPLIAMLPRLDAEDSLRAAAVAWAQDAKSRKALVADLERRANGGRRPARKRTQLQGRAIGRAFGQMGISIQRAPITSVSAAAAEE